MLSFLCFSSLIFKDNHIFNKKKTNFRKSFIVEEELDEIDTDRIRDLEDLPDLYSSMRNVGILK